MPTRRAIIIFILAVALYLIANQTQVGWVYLMVDALLALLLVAFVYGLGNLRGLRGERIFRNLSADNGSSPPDSELTGLLQATDFFEDDPVAVTLRLQQTGLRPAFIIAATDHCPFAPPDDAEQSLFVLALFITPDGSTPVAALNLSDERLRVKSVSPQNWVQVLQTL